MRLFDTHCHFERAEPSEIAAVLKRAKAAGVEKLMAVGGSPALNESAALAGELGSLGSLKSLESHASLKTIEDIKGSRPFGTLESHASLKTLETLKTLPKVCCALGFDREQVSSAPSVFSPTGTGLAAWGEIGLDYHYSPETRAQQLELFSSQLQQAHERNLPVVIHTREAADDTIALLKEIPSRGIIHCFTGDPDEARAYLDLGFYISFSGIITFRLADNVRASGLIVPDDRILIETDSPFLAPVPMRGNPNEPAFIKYTCEFIADLRGVAADDFAELTFANAVRILGGDDLKSIN